MNVYYEESKSGIRPAPEFAKKGLAEFSVNVGWKCDNGCYYCSSGAVLRRHPVFKKLKRWPYGRGYAIIDPNKPQLVAQDARSKRKRGCVMLCTTVDAWSPVAQQHNLGRQCLAAILSESDWTVRILTKNAAVVQDFDLIERFRNRVQVGLSITATPDRADVTQVLEPNASSIDERLDALREAHERGLRTYAMYCPLLPGICDEPSQIDELMQLAVAYGAEEVFVEPINGRGTNVNDAIGALRQAGFETESAALAKVRTKAGWSRYAQQLAQTTQASVRANFDIRDLRFLLYRSYLNAANERLLRRDDAGIVWLGQPRETRKPRAEGRLVMS